jgi:hypothetical protein
MGRDDLHGERAGVAVDPAEQLLGGHPSDRVGILRDDGNRRVEQVAQQEVVEAHQRHLVLATEAS